MQFPAAEDKRGVAEPKDGRFEVYRVVVCPQWCLYNTCENKRLHKYLSFQRSAAASLRTQCFLPQIGVWDLFQEWCRVWKWQKCAFVTWAVTALSRSFLAKPSLARWFLGGKGSKTNPLCGYTILQCKEHVWLPHCWHLPSISAPSAECNLQWAGECLMAFVELHLLCPPRLKQILSSSELPLCWFFWVYFWGDPCLSHTQFLWDFWDLIWK